MGKIIDEKQNNSIRINIAIGTITIYACIVLLYVVNNIIIENYHPDTTEILKKVADLFIPQGYFAPEPIERMQFQVSLILSPIFIFMLFNLINKRRNFFCTHPLASGIINIIGFGVFFIYLYIIFKHKLPFINNTNSQPETNSYFFINNIIDRFNVVAVCIYYLFISCVFIYYYRYYSNVFVGKLVKVSSYSIVSIILLNIILYNVFHLEMQETDRVLETNAVFYSLTQVIAGKSLLVDINAQYGLYAWLLCPLFKLIGLSIYKFTLTFGIINGISFLLIYIGIKKIIRNDLLSLTIFLCVVFWQYWQVRLPLESTPRYYYQYWPIRFLFPSIAFFLVVSYQAAKQSARQTILILLSLASSFAILWNLDSGIVVYGAVFAALLYEAGNSGSVKDCIKKALYYAVRMLGALFFVIFLFLLTTKLKSGVWPDFQKFKDFQTIFYVSGYYMLPMTAIHFWNIPVLVYLIACLYCVFNLRRNKNDTPVIVFLFILGFGLFAYFQGRSYDTTIMIVMYPSIIILGIFCNKLLSGIVVSKHKSLESIVLFFMLFCFLFDGASSMVGYIPSIYSFSSNNAFSVNAENKEFVKKRADFIITNSHKNDTILILSKDYESYFYALGNYYNPANIPSSTEVFLKSEVFSVLDVIKSGKYPVFYETGRPWVNEDTIIKTLAKYTYAAKEIGPDHSLVLLKPLKEFRIPGLIADSNTIYFNNLGDFNRYFHPNKKLGLSSGFVIELFASFDSSKLAKGNVMFSDSSKITPFTGWVMVQNGSEDLNKYMFTYGNGRSWCHGATCILNYKTGNHLLVKVQNDIISIYNNDNLSETINTDSSFKKSDDVFFISPNFSGTVTEMKISKMAL